MAKKSIGFTLCIAGISLLNGQQIIIGFLLFSAGIFLLNSKRFRGE